MYKKKKNSYLRFYIYILFYFLIFIKFSTTIVYSDIYKITKIEIAEPYDLNFNKKKVINKAFKIGFGELINKITIPDNNSKIKKKNLKIIESLIDSFTIIDEKFVDSKYYATFEVNFNKKLVLKYLEKKNIFPSIPIEKKIFIMPILIDLETNQISLFSENFFYINWNIEKKKYHLIKYILPTEDLDDVEIIKKNIEKIEDYNFKDILLKYDLNDYIISIFFKNKEKLKVLSKIKFNKKNIILNSNFENIDFQKRKLLEDIIFKLKTNFENEWKKINQINTSIKLPLTLQIKTKNYDLIRKFENKISKLDFVSKFYIENFNNEITTYKIIYNSTPDRFMQEINKDGIKINTSFKIWRIQ